jgi:uncharacterized protein
MSLFAILCTINPAKLALFGNHRGDHYEFLIAEQHRIRFGGPARSPDGGAPETMIIIVEAADLDEAEAFIAAEPYNQAGGFSSVVVRSWSQVLPEQEPGSLVRAREIELQKREG